MLKPAHIVTVLLAGVVCGLTGVTPARAAAHPSGEVAAFPRLVLSMNLSTEVEQRLITAFDQLSEPSQHALLDQLSGPEASAVFETVEDRTTVAAQDDSAGAPQGAPGLAPTYQVTATYRSSIRLLGVTLGSFHERYIYKTGSGVVLADYSCAGWYNGLSGFWALSASTSHWVSGGRGNCRTMFTGHFIFRGSNIAVHKEMGLTTDGAGIVAAWIRNV